MKTDIIRSFKKILREEEERESFKMKDWDEIFTFQKMDEKNPGKFKDVEIKMRDVMDRIDHWRKRYKKECEENDEKGDKGCDDGEDDSFVRSVIDTHPDVVRVLFTKGLANLTTSDEKIKMEEGFINILRVKDNQPLLSFNIGYIILMIIIFIIIQIIMNYVKK